MSPSRPSKPGEMDSGRTACPLARLAAAFEDGTDLLSQSVAVLRARPDLPELAFHGVEPQRKRANQRVQLVDLAVLIRDPDLELDDISFWHADKIPQ